MLQGRVRAEAGGLEDGSCRGAVRASTAIIDTRGTDRHGCATLVTEERVLSLLNDAGWYSTGSCMSGRLRAESVPYMDYLHEPIDHIMCLVSAVIGLHGRAITDLHTVLGV